MTATDPLAVGVVGVGSMGVNHARIYDSLPDVDLVGVTDADPDRAAEVADRYDTRVLPKDELLDSADAVSVVVPTRFHADTVRQCLDEGVHVLVEKPFVADLETGADLAAEAAERGLTLQVGHVERFNPAVSALSDLVSDLDLIAISADRIGPPVDRDSSDDVVMDLMIHDIDILLQLVDADVASIAATGTADGAYSTTQLTFADGTVGSLTASRVSQRRQRKLEVTASDRLIELDYLDQSIRVHRQAEPAYEATNDGVRYRNKRVTEQPLIDTAEPLKRELGAFVTAVREGTTPLVTADDALRAIEVAQTVRERMATARTEVVQR